MQPLGFLYKQDAIIQKNGGSSKDLGIKNLYGAQSSFENVVKLGDFGLRRGVCAPNVWYQFLEEGESV